MEMEMEGVSTVYVVRICKWMSSCSCVNLCRRKQHSWSQSELEKLLKRAKKEIFSVEREEEDERTLFFVNPIFIPRLYVHILHRINATSH